MRQLRPRIGLGDDLLHHRFQVVQAAAAGLLQLIGKAAKLAQPLYRWRIKSDNDGFIDAHQLAANGIQHARGAMLFAFALAYVFQAGKNNSLVGGAAAETETRHGENAFHVMVRAHHGCGAVHYPGGVLQ